jgi:type VI secretion system FHA domain protein
MIAIRLVSQAGEAPALPLKAVFGEAGGDIGRSVDCTLVLPDPERRISRKHLQVSCRDGGHYLRLISTNLLVELDGVPLAPGGECALEPGAQIRIGPFVLQAVGLAASVSAHEPGQQGQQEHPREHAPKGEREDEGGDDSMALFVPPGSSRPSVFADLLHEAAPALAAGAPALEIDLLVGEPTGAGLRDPAAASGSAPEPVPGSALQGGAADAWFDALYAGLGLAPPGPAARSAAQAELVGALLRACVGGTLGLLAGRTIAKRELGASPTQIQTRQNNPLKFAPDADIALALLLEPPRRGFVAPVAAVRDAFDDLRAHEVALLAGMRGALAAVLDRLSPATLELRLAEKGLWDNLMPVNRKARLWERYIDQHTELAREIEDNFDAIFAGAFIEAYEAQLARLTRSA